jgi:hypothetical protein
LRRTVHKNFVPNRNIFPAPNIPYPVSPWSDKKNLWQNKEFGAAAQTRIANRITLQKTPSLARRDLDKAGQSLNGRSSPRR